MDPNKDLLKRIEKIEAWQKARDAQQVTFPLDIQSINVLKQHFMRITGKVVTISGLGGNIFTEYVGEQADKRFSVFKNTYSVYVVDPTTNVFKVTDQYFPNDLQVYVATSDTTPTPLTDGTLYYVVSSTGLTFKLSLSQGGAEINVTDAGTGTQYLYYL